MPTNRRVLAGGLVLAADMVTGWSVTWPALAVLVVGLALAVLGIAILTSRCRSPSGASSRQAHPPRAGGPLPLFTARSRVVAPESDTTSSTVSVPAPEEDAVAQVAPPPAAVPAAAARDEPAAVGRDGTAGDVDGGHCDWELRVDVSDGDPVVVREAAGRPCCVHVLRVRSLDALPASRERAVRTWSGDRTRIGPSRAVSDVRSERRHVQPRARGLDLTLETTLGRQDLPSMVTTMAEAGADQLGRTTAEHLWSAHLVRLRDANVTSHPDEGPARLQTAIRYRTEVALHTTRGCDTSGHRLDATADVSVDVQGEVGPTAGTRLRLPNVAGWIEGDLRVAATDPIEVSPGTEVHPAPGLDGAAGLAVGAAPGSGEVRASFAGHAERTVVDDGIGLLMTCAVVADLGLGEAVGHHSAAEARIMVGVVHGVRLVVTPHAADVGAEGAERFAPACTCAPAYEVQFGAGPDGEAQAPHARLHVDDRSFRLDLAARSGATPAGSWTVRPDEDGDEA